jgi:outer membrane murein-binding lipoprotein Lpp
VRREQKHKNEEATKKVAELESKVQEAERDRNKLRLEVDAAKS